MELITRRRSLGFFLPLVLAGMAHGAELYPTKVPTRLFGTDQGNVGSCASEAEISALEGAFLNRGYAVKFSLFYQHAYNSVPHSADKIRMISYSAEDLELIRRIGPLVPYYMWPEEAAGYDPRGTGIRPHLAQSIVWDPTFPRADSLGYKSSYYTLKPGSANSIDLLMLKRMIEQRLPIVLSMHAELLQPSSKGSQWNSGTGLLKSPYQWSRLIEDVRESRSDKSDGTEHAISVVGYDDSLYQDHGYTVPGAIIIRNSWNNGSAIDMAMDAEKSGDPDLYRMRYKISSINLPGYYAIPYQYILDLISNGIGGVHVHEIDYNAYAVKYFEYSKRYEIVMAPYVCLDPDSSANEMTSTIQVFMNQLRLANRSELSRIVSRELGSRVLGGGYHPLFRYALLARNSVLGIDRARQFYAGEFSGYYCVDPLTQQPQKTWPTFREYENRGVRVAIDALSAKPKDYSSWFRLYEALGAALNL